MHYTSDELVILLTAWMWPFLRIGAMLVAIPVFGSQNVPLRLRIGLAMALTVMVVPLLPAPPPIDPFSGPGLFVAAQQILIGLTLGFSLHLIFSAVVTGGQIMAMKMGLGFASMVDPQTGIQVPVVSQLYLLLATLLFLIIGGHLVAIEVLVASFHSMPPGGLSVGRDHFWMLVMWGTQMFTWAVLIALPVVAVVLAFNVAFGVMSKAAPQLQIFSIGFPIFITMGFATMWASLPFFLPQFTQLTSAALELMQRLATP